MSRKKIIAGFCTVLIMLVACGGGGSNRAPGTPVTDLPISVPPPSAGILGDGTLDDIVEWTRASHGIPALGVVVVHNGLIVESAAEGLRSAAAAEPVTVDDLWHIGSLTKNFTSSLAGVLVDMSVLSWTTRPIDVWPELDATIHPQLRDVTLRQLLSHTAGIPRADTAPSQYGDLAAGSIIEKRRGFAADLLSQTPIGPVGQESYSNGGYVIAGAMMETLMSDAWESLITTYVFSPLNMSESGFGAPGEPDALTQPWGHWDEGVNFRPVSPGLEADNPQVLGPAGTIHTSLRDYANYMMAHIDGANGVDGFVTASTFATLHTPVTSGSALGWGVKEVDGEPGIIELTHAGSNLRWYSVVTIVPELGVGALYVANAGGDLAAAAISSLDDVLRERFGNTQ